MVQTSRKVNRYWSYPRKLLQMLMMSIIMVLFGDEILLLPQSRQLQVNARTWFASSKCSTLTNSYSETLSTSAGIKADCWALCKAFDPSTSPKPLKKFFCCEYDSSTDTCGIVSSD